MNVFDAAIAVLFADPHLAVSATYRAGGDGPDVALRIMVSQPDARTNWNEVSYVVKTTMIDVQQSDCPTPAEGDVFVFGGKTYTMQGQPEADVLQQVWTLVLVAA